jgi:hypothetical protein
MQNQDILAQLIQLNKVLSDTLIQIEKGDNLKFYKESIKHTALHIFENASLLDSNIKNTKTTPAIKIIKQQEIIPIEAPVIINTNEEESVKPIINEVKTPTPVAPIPKEEFIKPTITEAKPMVVKSDSVDSKKPIITIPSELEEDDNSLNAKLAKNKVPVQNVADKLTGLPIKDLAKAISISKKFELIKELFNNNGDAYKATLENIEKSANYFDAEAIIENEKLNNSKWTENEDLAEEFVSLVKRRFI